MIDREVLCPYCGKQAVLTIGTEVSFIHPNVSLFSYWVCFPCEAFVGTHKRNVKYNTDGTEPLGTLANLALRRKRLQLHDAMDPIWKKLKWKRDQMYRWLAKRMGITYKQCHIGLFNEADCDKAMELLKELAEFTKAKRNEE